MLKWAEGNIRLDYGGNKRKNDKKHETTKIADKAFHFFFCGSEAYEPFHIIGLLLIWRIYHGLHSQLRNIFVV